jgi:hypothetical protein
MHRTPCRARDFARRDVSEVRPTTTCLVFRPYVVMRRLPIKPRVAEPPPSCHRLGPLHVPLEAKWFRQRAVAIPIVPMGGFVTKRPPPLPDAQGGD